MHKLQQCYDRYLIQCVCVWKCSFIKGPRSCIKDVGLQDVLPVNAFHGRDDAAVITRHRGESSANKNTSHEA